MIEVINLSKSFDGRIERPLNITFIGHIAADQDSRIGFVEFIVVHHLDIENRSSRPKAAQQVGRGFSDAAQAAGNQYRLACDPK